MAEYSDKYMMESLTGDSALRQISEIRKFKSKKVLLDFSNMRSVRSAGMILFLICIKDLLRNENYEFWCSNKNLTHGCSYADTMGFFDALGLQGHVKVGTYKGRNDDYLGIQRITERELILLNPQSDDFYPGLETYCEKIARVLTKNNNLEFNKKLETFLKYSIREIIRNTFEHTTKNEVFIAAQRHENAGYIELVISDEGEGIRRTLSVNKALGKINDSQALRYAIQPGISMVSGDELYQKRNRTNLTGNSGYGLYVTSELFKKIGDMKLISGSAVLDIKSNTITEMGFKYPGTAVVLNVYLNELDSVSDNEIEQIVALGEKSAQDDPNAIKKASKSSRIF